MSELAVICSVPFHRVNQQEALQEIANFMESGKQHLVVTANPEFVLEAQENHNFRNILFRASLSVPDGIGILWASTFLHRMRNIESPVIRYCYLPFQLLGSLMSLIFYPKYTRQIFKERVTGVDLFQDVSGIASQKAWRIFLLGGKSGVAAKVKKILEKVYPGIQVVGHYAGSPDVVDETRIVQEINDAEPDILFVAYGAPNQEFWISRNLSKVPSVKMAMGIGGAFDMVSGERKRAPEYMQKLGLEWLWRLVKEPKRAKRIYNATVRFVLLVIKEKIRMSQRKEPEFSF